MYRTLAQHYLGTLHRREKPRVAEAPKLTALAP
jgi:hypothetical protein